MRYSFISAREQAELVRQRLATMEVEHYQHEISKTIGRNLAQTASGQRLAEAQKMVADAEAAQAVIEEAMAVLHRELETLNGAQPQAPEPG